MWPPGTQVWAKVEGYRWWPATVLHANELPVATTAKGDDERVMVRFHETNDLGSLPLSKILDFAEHLK
ncbi:hypothetical protein OAD67_02360, partial [bacterium]|nr:hypothetical protein [bacterium]